MKKIVNTHQLHRTVFGQTHRPRLSAYRSLTNIFAQVIDDTNGKTLAAASSLKQTGSLQTKATVVGKEIASKIKELKIKAIVFDRGGQRYHGAVKKLCEAVRQAGIEV